MPVLAMKPNSLKPLKSAIISRIRVSQYTFIASGQRYREAGVRSSIGLVGTCYDNAMCESFFANQRELLDRRRFPMKAEARMAVFSFIEGWYNYGVISLGIITCCAFGLHMALSVGCQLMLNSSA